MTIAMRRIIAGVGCAAAVALAACGSMHVSHPPATRGHASALASIPGYDKQAALVILARDGVPVHGSAAQQVAFGRAMMTSSGRHALAVRLAIPQANRSPFGVAVLGDAERDHVVTSHAGRQQFWQDLAGELVKYQ